MNFFSYFNHFYHKYYEFSPIKFKIDFFQLDKEL